MIFAIKMHWIWFLLEKCIENYYYCKKALDRDFYPENPLEINFIIKMQIK